MNNSPTPITNAPAVQVPVQDMPSGPISDNMHTALVELSSMVHLMGDNAHVARKLLHTLFDCRNQVAILESSSTGTPQEVGHD